MSDGDTITLLTPDKRPVRVRLAKIDAPELHEQPYGQAAKTSLSSLVYRRQVTADVVTVDRYGRAVALVDVGGVDVNAAMVREGMAWAYVRYQIDPRFSALEATARRERRGLWRDPLPVPPWRYRRAANAL